MDTAVAIALIILAFSTLFGVFVGMVIRNRDTQTPRDR